MSKKILNIPIPPTSPIITPEQLSSQSPFYEGEYCDVFCIKKSNKEYAVKAIYLNRITDGYDQQFNRICSEIKILYSVDHPGIIKLLGHFQREEVIGLIFPMFGRPIQGFIRDRKKKTNSRLFTVNDFLRVFRSVGSAIAQLHALGYIHRDISGDNVLIDDNFNTKLIDFGCVGNIDYSKGYFGTRQFLAPEILEKRSYNHKVDIWSFGILCFEILFGVYLFKPKVKNLSEDELDQHYLINMKQPIQDPSDEKLLTDEKPQPQLIMMIKSMLNYNPDKRPQIGYLLSKKIFGAEQREALTYNIEQYARQKTSRKSNRAYVSLNSNVKEMSIRELEETLFNLVKLNAVELNRERELFETLVKEERKLVEIKYGRKDNAGMKL